MGRKKKICTPAIPHISQEPHECGKLSGVQIFLVEDTVKKYIQILLANLLLVHTPIVNNIHYPVHCFTVPCVAHLFSPTFSVQINWSNRVCTTYHTFIRPSHPFCEQLVLLKKYCITFYHRANLVEATFHGKQNRVEAHIFPTYPTVH